MLGRTDSRARLLALLAVFVLLSGGMAFRLAYWQVASRPELTSLTDQANAMSRSIPAKRGTIYDRSGTIVLAQTIYRYRVIADLHDISDTVRKRDTDSLVDYLQLTGQPEADFRKAMTGKGYYVILATNIDPDTGKDIADAQALGALTSITLDPTPVRVYPQAGAAPHTSLAAQMLGFVNAAGRGQYGLEQQYDALLAGKPQIIQVDPNKPGPAGMHIVDPGVPGEDIRTTIDVGLQLKVEGEVFSTWIADKAETVSAIVMDPKTGAVLAEASYPSYDANAYQQVATQNPGIFVDPVISEIYEPGSVFKMLTASAALETKTTALATKINDSGVLKLPGGQEVADADRKSKGLMTFADIVAWSRNVGVSQVAFRLGKTTNAASAALYKTWQAYGIGRKTGIDLAGEVAGIVHDPAAGPWSQIDLANASFGQGVAVPPIQMVTAYSVMANGGLEVTPHVVETESPKALATKAPAPKRVITSSLSNSLVGLMEHVLTAVPSYNQATFIPGYFVGGKTGTAQIWDPAINKGKGGWLDDIYNYSCFGWVGHATPDMTIGVVIYRGKPTKVAQGVLAMPVQSTELFRRVATDTVVTLKIAPNKAGPPAPAGQKAKSLGDEMAQTLTRLGLLCDTEDVTDTRQWDPRPGAGPLALTAIQIAAATGGRLVRPSARPIRGGAVDSRLVEPGNLFVALPGEKTDGHRFIGAAVAAGAAAVLVLDGEAAAAADAVAAAAAAAPSASGAPDVAIVAVPDTLLALHAVAAEWRRRFSPLVVGVTGSIAKTSTKEAVAAVLARRFTTLKSEGNANNEVGLPLTVLRLAPQHEAAVLEMGMYVGGEIAQLAAIAKPKIGVVTAVHEVHLSRIGTIDAVERAKAELIEALPADGFAILNADDPRVARMCDRTAARTITYGFSPTADVQARDVVSNGLDGMAFTLVVPDGAAHIAAYVSTPALGRHGVHNGLAAAAVGMAAGLNLDEITAGLRDGWQAAHRDQLVRIPGLTILDDTYNASPASMRAALELLATLPGRHVAVLGEMFELGEAHERGHREVGAAAAGLVDELIVVGSGAAGIAAGAQALGEKVVLVPDRGSALPVLRQRIRRDDSVLVKASRGAALELIVEYLSESFGGWTAGGGTRGEAPPIGEEVW